MKCKLALLLGYQCLYGSFINELQKKLKKDCLIEIDIIALNIAHTAENARPTQTVL